MTTSQRIKTLRKDLTALIDRRQKAKDLLCDTEPELRHLAGQIQALIEDSQGEA